MKIYISKDNLKEGRFFMADKRAGNGRIPMIMIDEIDFVSFLDGLGRALKPSVKQRILKYIEGETNEM